jgi:hypothetical protein
MRSHAILLLNPAGLLYTTAWQPHQHKARWLPACSLWLACHHLTSACQHLSQSRTVRPTENARRPSWKRCGTVGCCCPAAAVPPWRNPVKGWSNDGNIPILRWLGIEGLAQQCSPTSAHGVLTRTAVPQSLPSGLACACAGHLVFS